MDPMAPSLAESPYAWVRLAACLVLMTIGAARRSKQEPDKAYSRRNVMLGLMQDWPLLCHRIIDHAAVNHGRFVLRLDRSKGDAVLIYGRDGSIIGPEKCGPKVLCHRS